MKIVKYIFVFLFISLLVGCSEDTIDSFGVGKITGTVVSQGDNEPIQNVKISTNPVTSTVFTDENGDFVIENVPAAEYSIQAKKDGLLTKFEGATVLSNAEINVIFEMLPDTGNNREPTTPQAIFPEDNSTDQDVTIDFSWSSSDPDGDELVYELQLRNNVNNDILKYSSIVDTTYTVEGLQFGYKYFWQIKVTDSINEPVLSPVYSFQTAQYPKSRYLYVKKVAGNNVIYSSDNEGNEYQLTSSNLNSFRPVKNNASNKIAFLRTVGGQTHLFTMDPDGANQIQVTSNIPVNGFNLDKISFSWAQDGATLVYPNYSKLYSINATGGGTALVYQTPSGKFITNVAVSKDNSIIALLTNNANGYDASIYTIDFSGAQLTTIIDNVTGALGGLDISVDKKTLLYTRDISAYESDDYRQLNSHIFLYTFVTGASLDISTSKENGTNDFEPRFSPNEALVIFTNTSNDGLSARNIFTTEIGGEDSERTLIFENSMMPDWE
ncbi:carboxypeptidase regulatory-like domain-containing protein [Gillisia sp. M10.2A]|uniref:Carboxypeptidase regulatory-like domain-containing protein n=1 Tax=Gillisia lutea TaxID=2909668 RepID=A0ABS9EI72_9FLAO|nr:carboxypeptidase regulatory-like domain-containing protein [Gillisia lutea]MCF4102052.1 carboxypeptidase regulatory-like domain-containing protein [Gillisia lutea]